MTRRELSEKISEIVPGKTSDWEKCSKTHLVKVYGWAKGINRVAKKEPSIEPAIRSRLNLDREDLLKTAKELGLFEKNKKYSRYEICVPIQEYRKI